MAQITQRERDVLRLIARGRSTKQIASDLGIAFKTAVTHRTHLMEKIEATNAANLIAKAYELRLLDPETRKRDRTPVRTELRSDIIALRAAVEESRALRAQLRSSRLELADVSRELHSKLAELAIDLSPERANSASDAQAANGLLHGRSGGTLRPH